MSANLNRRKQKTQTNNLGCRESGFILLPVVLAITLVASIAFLMNREGALQIHRLGGEIETAEAQYAAKAGFNRMLWQLDQANCTGYSDIAATSFGKASYSVTVNPTSGSPVSISATGTHPSGARYTIKRDGVNVGHGPTLTKVIQPDAATAQDTYISYLNSTTNYGTNTNLGVTHRSGIHQRSLLQFNLTRFTSAATIMRADLSLYQNTSGTLGGPISIHRILGGAWSETGASWNNRNIGLTWTTAGGDYDALPITTNNFPASLFTWFTWDITPLIQGWISGTYPNNGLILIPDTVNSDAFFYSSDAGNTLIPKITITYNCPCGVECYTAAPPITVTLNPVADAFIDSQNATRNYGASTSLNIKFTTAPNQKRSLLKFDASTIPAGALIQSAKLRLNVANTLIPSSNPKTVSAYALTQAWTEGSRNGSGSANGTTWNTYNGSTAWTTPGGAYRSPSVAMAVEETSGISPPPASFTSGWLYWDLTALAQEWGDGVTVNNGVLLISSIGDELIIDSKEKGGISTPQLIIIYQQ